MWGDGEVVRLVGERERGAGGAPERLRRSLAATRPLVDRLGLEAELRGHEGCVNCLEWNQDGSVLASGSDDLRVILWDPLTTRALRHINTGHMGNIFSVKFVDSGRVATCAGDCTVRVHEVLGGGAAPLLVCSCHRARVKRLAHHAATPAVLWSAGEDGLVLRHDVRAPHTCGPRAANVVVRLSSHAGRFAEAKCVAASPTREHHLAVGANDFYVRLYDTRMVKLTARGGEGAGAGDSDGVSRHAATYFAPGHLSTDPEVQSFPKMATTYLTFSPDGNELLVNLGSEQVYIFDVCGAPRPLLLDSHIIRHNHARDDVSSAHPSHGHKQHTPLHPRAAKLKEAGDECVRSSRFAEGVSLYSEAVWLSPRCAVLYSNRATALLRRGWAGDLYAAVRDCYAAIDIDPDHLKSHFRLAKALLELRRSREAHEALVYFKRKFPQHASSHAVHLLARDIAAARAAAEPQRDAREDDEHAERAERARRAAAGDYSQRFLGHCNVTTDIKEAAFLGSGYVLAGSDDGALLVWARATCDLVRALRADDSILNCVQPHPRAFLVATSGIESVVRLWSARPLCDPHPRLAAEPRALAAANQLRMRSDPFESMLLNVGGADRDLHPLPCRPS